MSTEGRSDKSAADTLMKKVLSKRKGDFADKNPKRIRSKEVQRGLEDSTLIETEYYFENYLRKVYPYYFTYTTFCKGRWVGRQLIDVFCEEFRAHSKEN
ncbi:RNA pseudouridylate synthase like protein [Argiope bruennichi]|uniref:RNA pseudouridylate synthase like protein n=1 Tax=Argiope bruennichi TaxID=94029 RepID=A0A8T0EFD9_ARGBR|nr:RNA pseudouridylate synthase like protein [Argiope bruennichi]